MSCCSYSYYGACALEASQQQQQTTPSDDQQQQQQQAAAATAAAAADMLGDDEQQLIPGADPAGGIAIEEAIRQRDESNARTANKREYGPQNCNGET